MTFPIVLAHGVCRFDGLINNILALDNNDDPMLDRLHYFRGIRTMLNQEGFRVHHSKVRWGAGIETRAEDLKRQIEAVLEKESTEKVNIIAHSMGGLDARHMMFNGRNSNRIHERIGSLTTISTPHEGSPFADWGTDHMPWAIQTADGLGLDLKAFQDLRTDSCKSFNHSSDVVAFEEEAERPRCSRPMPAGRNSGEYSTLSSSHTTLLKRPKEIMTAWFRSDLQCGGTDISRASSIRPII